MILHLKSAPNVICINQQSDLGAIPAAHCITHQNGRDAPRDFNTIKYTKKQVVFRSASSFAPKSFHLFRRIDALLQGFLVLLRSILSEPGDEKTCLRGFWPDNIQSSLLSYRC